MKFIHLPILSLLLAVAAQAADLAPNVSGSLADVPGSLVREPLQSTEFHLGLDYIQGKTDEVRNIQRRLNLAVGLPLDTSVGISLIDTQEGAMSSVDHASSPMNGLAFVRLNILQSEALIFGASLQYQPGVSHSTSAYQASQDRTTFGLDLTIKPLSYFETAVYGSYSRRDDERYQDLLLGQESQIGLRLALGSASAGFFGDSLQRHLAVKGGSASRLFARQHTLGFYAGMEALQFSAFTTFPDQNRYPGVQERSYGASVTMRLGAKAHSDKPVEDALKAVDQADKEAKAQEVKAPVETTIKMLETNEPDEFQLLERKEREAAKKQAETAAEKAERQLREGAEAEKKLEARKAAEIEKAKQDAEKAERQQIRDGDEYYQKNKDELETEINAYTLPDKEEMNWNGLIK